MDAAADADAVERDFVDRAVALKRLGRLVLHADDEDATGLQRGRLREAHVGEGDLKRVRRAGRGAGGDEKEHNGDEH